MSDLPQPAAPVATEHFATLSEALKQFPAAEMAAGGEGWIIYFAQRDGDPYAITDEGTMAALLYPEDEDLAGALIAVHRFASAVARGVWLAARLPQEP